MRRRPTSGRFADRWRLLALGVVLLAVALMAWRLAARGGNMQPMAVAAPGAPAVLDPAGTPLSLAAQVGKAMFFDPALSGSGRLSCASCHDPARAYGPPNALAVQLGGAGMASAGIRAVPSLRYKNDTPAYADALDNPDGLGPPAPGGGFGWDGRASTLAEQAALPLLSAFEMGNASAAAVVDKIRAAAYVGLFKQAFGAAVFDDPASAFAKAGAALQAFQLEDVSFHPFTSRFDLHAGNKKGGTLTPAELRGLRIYVDPQRGNCMGCHFQGAGLNGSVSLFTDFTYAAIGVPRNGAIPANGDPAFFDLGLCGPLRQDHRPASPGAANALCGQFKTPTLRNAASRPVFFHNGVMDSLEQVVRFYNTRDTMPELWYPTQGGKPKAVNDAGFPTYGLVRQQYTGGVVRKYDDLPRAYRPNIDLQMPLDGRARGSKPPLTEQEVNDLICFLYTLSDHDAPPARKLAPGACG
jgi:cytochrome c peroxidase